MKESWKSLEVDFHGPFAFHFCQTEVWVFLPMCANHKCNVLTDSNDVSPKMHQVLSLVGPVAVDTNPGDGHQFVWRPWEQDWKNGPGKRKCYCIFRLPSPNSVHGLRAEYLKIDIPNETFPDGFYARGLRFCYKQCDPKLKIMPQDGAASGSFVDLDATTCGDKNRLHIEIRFHDTKYHRKIDHHHRDAMSCSKSMRKHFPPCDEWTVKFEPSRKIRLRQHGGTHPVDCGANLIAFIDPITLRSKLSVNPYQVKP
jgi:hypothetical protein